MFYLQRIKIEAAAKKGEDSKKFYYDYMGADEYEFGAIGQAYQEFKDGYVVAKTGIHAKDGRSLMVIVPKQVSLEMVIERVKWLSRVKDYDENNREILTKERTYIKEAVEGTIPSHIRDVNCWMSVNSKNVFFAYLGEKLTSVIEAKINEQLKKG